MGVHPFRAAFLEHRQYAPRELGLRFGGDTAEVHLLPGPAAYIGADLAAGMVATGLLYDDGPALLVDVGTNGEIIAKVGDQLFRRIDNGTFIPETVYEVVQQRPGQPPPTTGDSPASVLVQATFIRPLASTATARSSVRHGT